jgi:hypothetical protein
VRHITGAFPGVDVVTAMDAYFFFSDPGDGTRSDHMFPFATVVTTDAHDSASNLSRPSVFRLNIGVSRETFRSLLGVSPSAGAEAIEAGRDFTALDRFLPHPVYASQSWVCVLNPSRETFRTVEGLLEEAHRLSAAREAKRAQNRS